MGVPLMHDKLWGWFGIILVCLLLGGAVVVAVLSRGPML
jgi:hypothetical protein